MNPEAIMTPGGIADQLTRGLSGLGQSFARREELRYQGQRDRMADDRYTAEMALRQQAQERADARMALEDRRYGEQQARLGRMDQLALEDRQRAQADAERKRRAMYPEDYVNSPDPQQSRSAQEALRRQEFDYATRGYVSSDQMQTLPGADFRAPMQPGQRLFGPVPGSAAAQGLEARDQSRKPNYGRTEEQRIAAQEAARRFQMERDATRARANRMEQITKEINNAKKDKEQRIKDALLAEGMTLGEQDGWLTSRDTALKNIAAARKAHESAPDPALQKLETELAVLQAMGGAAGALGAPSQVAPSNTGNIEDDIVNGAPSFKP
jgi:hypothetical protein